MLERTDERQITESITAVEFWRGFLFNKHPQIIRSSKAIYPIRQHGESIEASMESIIPDIPASVLNDVGWREPFQAMAINSVVDVCNVDGCKHLLEDHVDIIAADWWKNHNCDPIYFENPKTFIFLDMEYCDKKTLEVVKESLKNTDNDFYIFNSGGGLHVVVDNIVELDELPNEYGQILRLFGLTLNSTKLIDWGDDLIQVGTDHNKIKKLCFRILSSCGHKDDSLTAGKEVYLVDLRHIAHSLLRLVESVDSRKVYRDIHGKKEIIYERFGAANLRISGPYGIYGGRYYEGKYKKPPFLIYKKEGDVEEYFENKFTENKAIFDLDEDELNLPILSTEYESEYLKKYNPLFEKNTPSSDEILNNEKWRLFLRTKIFSLFVTMDAAACNGSVNENYLIKRDKKLISLNDCFKLIGAPEVEYNDNIDPLSILFDLKIKSLQAMKMLSNPKMEMSQEGIVFEKNESQFLDVKKEVEEIIDKEDVWGIYGSSLVTDKPEDIDVVLIINNLDVNKYIKIINMFANLRHEPKISPQIIPKEYFSEFWSSDDYDLFAKCNFVLMGGEEKITVFQRNREYIKNNKLFNLAQNIMRIRESITPEGLESLLNSEAKANHTLKQAIHFRKKLMDSLDIDLPKVPAPEKWNKKEGEYLLKRKLLKVYFEIKKMLFTTHKLWSCCT